MEEFVFFISGKVARPLTIDPTVWIFDERKIDLEAFFESEEGLPDDNDLVSYTKAVAKKWDKEMLEGSEPPNPNRDSNQIAFERQKWTNGSFGMPLKPFIRNAAPNKRAKAIEIRTTDGETFPFSIEQGDSFIAAFSEKGQPLKEDGPVHVYLADGSSKEPVRRVREIVFV
ncbi:peptidyl-prolyl cis-trans isomerase [Shouchella tritolerans]|uniref:peptidyl-prolyl cis-trans isomerase n=1 Tax=Shouchella tritolerans TaxID=2979466 RepID=UPI0021E772E4|nr:peptidyl-prolyl cis-trans isomerase [Shouchella tritolerans]